MNKDIVEGKWKEVKGFVKAKWGKLTDDDIEYIAGRGEQLSGILQKRYGKSKEEADKEVDAFSRKYLH